MTAHGELLSTVSALAIILVSAPSFGEEALKGGFLSAGDMPRAMTGVVGTYGGFSTLSYVGEKPSKVGKADPNYPSMGLFARVDIPLTQIVGAQVDFGIEGTSTGAVASKNGKLKTEDNYAGNAIVGGHLYVNEPGRYLFGAFAGAGNTRFNYVSSKPLKDGKGAPADFHFGGVEGQAYFGDTTLYAQLGLVDAVSPGKKAAVLEDAYFARGVIRHVLPSGQTKFEGELSYAKGKDIGSKPSKTQDIDIVGWGIQFDQALTQFDNSNRLSAFVRYSGKHTIRYSLKPSKSNISTTEHTIMVGLKYAFGDGNFSKQNIYGTKLDLPNLGSWVGAPTVTQ